MPSSGILPWLQGMLCNLKNSCFNYPTPGEAPGQVNNFNSSLLSTILLDLQSLASILPQLVQYPSVLIDANDLLTINNLNRVSGIQIGEILRDDETFSTYLKENLTVPVPVVESIKTGYIQPMVLTSSLNLNLQEILCNKSELGNYVTINSTEVQDVIQNISCSLSAQQVNAARREFIRNIDPNKLVRLLSNETEIVTALSNAIGGVLSMTQEVSAMDFCVNKMQRKIVIYKSVGISIIKLVLKSLQM
nr:PREDICTED: ATP-binding cassette sub-family A member 1-like [Latimeria chalumnae]|eukprot:XP_014349982.1 PREDICTED: ATP-binding cassette sub-family A member 1-like [Latimeria chalumnae]